MKNPKMSLIIPVYNVSDCLSRCVDSVLSQTLYDIEIIFVNDGSTDNSRDILTEYQKMDSRITVLDKENGGLSSARNYGMKYATGEYILFVDSDDYIERNLCERVYVEILETAADIIVFGANMFPKWIPMNLWVKNNLSVRTVYYDNDIPRVILNENGAYPYVWRNCYKRDFLNRTGICFDETLKFAEDIFFQFVTFPFARNISFIEDKLYNYRHIREGSLMNKYDKDIDAKFLYHVEIVNKITEVWQKNGWLNDYKKDYFGWFKRFLVYDLIDAPYQNKNEKAEMLLNIIDTYELCNKARSTRRKSSDKALRELKRCLK